MTRNLPYLLAFSVVLAFASCDRAGGGIDLDVLFPDAGPVDGGDDIDGGPGFDAGTPPDAGDDRVGCDPPASATLVDPRTVATACVMDRWLDELPRLPANLQYARVKAAVDDASLASTFPLRTGTRVVFVAEIVAGEVPQLEGDFNAWDPSRGPMQPLAQSGFAFREETLDRRSHAYRFVYAPGTDEERHVVDPGVRWLSLAPDDGTLQGLAVVDAPALPTGLVRWVPRFDSAELGAERDLFLWLPAVALGATTRFSAVYAYDGRDLLVRSRADLALEERTRAGHPPVIGVFVDVPATARRDDYTFGTTGSRGPRTARFVADEVVPWVDAHFPTATTPAGRAIAGASFGGLQALFTGWNHADTFGHVAAQSGTFYWPEPSGEALTREIEAAAVRPLRVYLDNGLPNDNETWVGHLADVLRDRGYDSTHVEVQGARHDWPDWGARWPGLLAWLFPDA